MRTLSLALVVLASVAHAGWTQEGDGAASFDAKGPAGFKIHGTAKNVKVADDGKQLVISLSILDVDTDNSLRNRHLQEDTQAATLPAISLTVPLDQLKAPQDGATAEGKATGTFALHGQTKSVEFTYKASCAKGACDITGTAPVMLSDYGVKVRSYLGITVKPDITVGASFRLKR